MTEYTLNLSVDVAQELEQAASQERRSVAEVIDQVLREYVTRRHNRQIELEFAHYQKRHAELLATYRGQCIAMHAGQVIDHDTDLATLHRRIRTQFGNTPILITPVMDEPVLEFHVRGPRLEG